MTAYRDICAARDELDRAYTLTDQAVKAVGRVWGLLDGVHHRRADAVIDQLNECLDAIQAAYGPITDLIDAAEKRKGA